MLLPRTPAQVVFACTIHPKTQASIDPAHPAEQNVERPPARRSSQVEYCLRVRTGSCLPVHGVKPVALLIFFLFVARVVKTCSCRGLGWIWEMVLRFGSVLSVLLRIRAGVRASPHAHVSGMAGYLLHDTEFLEMSRLDFCTVYWSNIHYFRWFTTLLLFMLYGL